MTYEKKISEIILTKNLSQNGIRQIIRALEMKKYIVSAILPSTPQSETFGHFLERFWDFDKSPYFFEKRIAGQSVHKRYAAIMLSRAKNYWIPEYGKRPLGSITVFDIKRRLQNLAAKEQKVGTQKKDESGNQIFEMKMLRPETVNQIVRCAVLALKWAYNNKLTENNCFNGIVFCHVVPEKRIVPAMEDAVKIFSADWQNGQTKLAHLISACTGMRIGEVRALQLKDIGRDRIFVRHNWARKEGLKSPKNGNEREIIVDQRLLALIREHAEKNPFGQCPSNFLFYGTDRMKPGSVSLWNKELHAVAEKLGIKNGSKITFHCWRHFFSANMADRIDLRKLQLVTGHKSIEMIEHYAAHQNESALQEIARKSAEVFSGLLG